MDLAERLQRRLAQRVLGLPPSVLARLSGPPQRSPEGYVLDPQSQAMLRLLVLLRRPEMHALGVDAGRRDMDRSAPIVDFDDVPVRWTVDRAIPGPSGASLPLRIFDASVAGKREKKRVLVYFHGGGFVFGSLASHEGVCRALAHKAGAVVVSVEYRRAPDDRFPAAVDDAVAATRWVIANAEAIGGDASAVAVGGDSAGGNLAAVVAQETRGDARRPAFQLLVYPATDLTRSFPSHQIFREGYMLTEASIDFFLSSYLSKPSDATDPRGSPLFATDLRGLPPAMVITAGFDPLRDEGRAYAAKLRHAGVAVEDLLYEGALHGFFSFGGVMDIARRAVDDAARALREALGPRTGATERPPAVTETA